MTHFIDRLLNKYDGADWLLQRKARTLLVLNGIAIATLLVEIIISSLLLHRIAPEFLPNMMIAIVLGFMMIPLIRGHYQTAASIGVVVVLAGITWTRYESTGMFSTDASYDFLQYLLDLILVLFYANLIARSRRIIDVTFIGSILLLGIYSYMLSPVYHLAVTSATRSVFVSGFIFLFFAGLISLYTFLQNRRAIDVANQESKASKESERNYREIFNSTNEAIFIHDASTGQILDVNDAMLKMYGFETKGEAIIHAVKDISAEESHYTQKEAEQNIRKAVTLGPQVFEWHAKKNSGETFWVEVSLKKSEIGGHGRILAVVRDITERKRSEATLRHSQKLESIGTLAGGIAHDFNNLLNAILGQSSLAVGKLPKDSPAVSNISKAIKASERAADLTRQLLAYSGRGKFYTETIDLNNVVRENINLLELSVAKSVELRYDFGSPSPCFIGDVAQIQQVIMNLIINAGEAMGSNPGVITVQTGRIDLTEQHTEYWKYTNAPHTAGSYALLQVKDTGSGISKETLTRIFDPFFTTKFTGRGLGLAAVLGIIKGHKGGLRIESEVGKGTLFEIVLPLITTTTNVDSEKKQEASLVKGSGKTILIIDDDTFVFELLEDVLREVHFMVIGATDPVQGIELFRREQENISLVILDYSMPNMDGKTAFAELKKINPDVKVLLCSGYTEEETLSTFGSDRPAGFFQKPYKPSSLVEKVSLILSKES